MPAVKKQPSGSRHRDRASLSVRGRIYQLLQDSADRHRRSISWELAEILLAHFVREGKITQEQSEELWQITVRRARRDDDAEE